MKKMTKILSLVLALAMVLGMTSMAAALTAPTNIIIYDDFSDVTDITAFTSTRTNIGTALGTTNYSPGAFSAGPGAVLKAAIDAGTPLTGKAATHFWATTAYGGTPFEVVKDADGNTIAIRDTSGDKRGVLIYALPTAFDYVDARENQKAIVFQYDWKPVSFRTTGTFYGVLANSMGIKTDDTEATGTGNYSVASVTNAETGERDSFNIAYQGGDTFGNGIALNSTHTVQRVYRQYNMYGEDTLWTPENTNGNLSEYLVHFSPFDRRYDYGGHFAETGAANQRKSIQAFYIPMSNNIQDEYANVLIYEVSLKSEDFYLATETVNNVELDGALELVFSQPLSANVDSGGAGDGNKEGTTLAENIVVNDGTNDLVYGTDYTVELSERVVGNEVKGILTVIPTADWAYDQTITVTLPNNMRSVARRTIYSGSNKVATFNTLAAPSFNIAINAYEGLAAGTAITADAMAGKTVYFTANATNTTGRAIEAPLAIGIYDGEGNLVKYAAMNSSFEDAGAASFSAAFKMEAGYTAKAFVKGTASEIIFR